MSYGNHACTLVFYAYQTEKFVERGYNQLVLKKITLLHKESNSSKEEYPFSIPSIQSLTELDLTKSVTFFVGENGSGKSTLLEGIADLCGFNSAGGGRNNTYEVDASESALSDYLRLSWMPKVTNGFFLRAESFYHFASHIDGLASDRALNSLWGEIIA